MTKDHTLDFKVLLDTTISHMRLAATLISSNWIKSKSEAKTSDSVSIGVHDFM